jgi:uncharacterized protein
MSEAPEIFFLQLDGRGQRLVLHHLPMADAARGVIVYVHPFAEEMNKSRRMAMLQSRAFARAGYAVLQIDLLGCGDSSGDFGDATWEDWVEDVLVAARWLRERYEAPLLLWGLRAGCLVAADAGRRLEEPIDFVFWQPVTAGKSVLQQLMRVKAAAEMQGGSAAAALDGMRAQLAAGDAVEVAGYRVGAALAQGLERATLALPERSGNRVTWLELSTREDAVLLPASAALIERWRRAAHCVNAKVVSGPSFWQTTEIEDAPALIAQTLALTSVEDVVA